MKTITRIKGLAGGIISVVLTAVLTLAGQVISNAQTGNVTVTIDDTYQTSIAWNDDGILYFNHYYAESGGKQVVTVTFTTSYCTGTPTLAGIFSPSDACTVITNDPQFSTNEFGGTNSETITWQVSNFTKDPTTIYFIGTASGLSCTNTLFVGGGCPSCQQCTAAGASSCDVGCVDFRVNLGQADAFNRAGFISLHADTPSTNLGSPAGLQVPFPETNVMVLTNSSGWIYEVHTPISLAIITNATANRYEIQMFTSNCVTGPTNGYYATNAADFVTYVVSNNYVSSTSNQLVITEQRSGLADRVFTYNYLSNSSQSMRWDLIQPDGTTVSKWYVTNSDPTVTNYNWEVIAGGTVLKSNCATVQFIPGLNLLLTNSLVEGTGTTTRTTTYTYYPTNAAVGSSNQLERVDYPEGNWVFYLYDSIGRVTNEFSAYGNSAPPTSVTTVPSVTSNLCRLTTYSYDSVSDSIDDSQVKPFVARTVSVMLPVSVSGSWQAQEVSRIYRSLNADFMEEQQCPNPNAPWGTLGNLRTLTFTYDTDDSHPERAGRVQSVSHPDGTATVYEYNLDLSSGQFTTSEYTGAPDDWQAPTTIVDGTEQDTVVDSLGRTLSIKQFDILSSHKLRDDEYTWSTSDPFYRNYSVIDLTGRTNIFNYACCGLDYMIDHDGVITAYSYDSMKRPVSSTVTRGSVSMTTTTTNDGLGQVLMTTRQGTNGSIITNLQTQYDVLGRVISKTNALGGTNTVNYGVVSGQLCVTNTYPDGGTCTNLYYRDGRTQSVTGTAVAWVQYAYGLEQDGTNWREYTLTVKLDFLGGTNEWTKSYADGAGRPYKTIYAASSGTNAYSLFLYSTNSTNAALLTNSIDPDGISTFYLYNGKAEPAYTIIDVNQNGNIDYTNGPDRITFVTNDVIEPGAMAIRRTQTYVWNTSANSSNLVSTLLRTADGLDNTNILWNNGIGVTNWSQTVYDANGYRYVTNMASDGSYSSSTNFFGQLLSVTRYDANNSQIGRVTNGYDTFWRQNTMTDARTGTTTNFFNNMDLISGAATPAPATGQSSQVSSNFFDYVGRITKIALPDNTSVTNVYYPTGLIQQTSGSRTYPVGYSYDAQGRITTMTNWSSFPSGGSRVTTWKYDTSRGWLTNKVYDGSTAGPSYTYTGAGRLLTRLWARGTNTTYTYNGAGDLITVAYNDSTPGITNGYDRLGRLTTVSNASIVCALGYNDAGNLTNESYTGGIMDKISITNGYDTLLRRTNVVTIYNGSVMTTVTNNYDAASRLLSIGDGTNSSKYSYLTNSRLVSQIAFVHAGATNMITAKTYNNLNRLTSISSKTNAVVVDQHEYTYNSANQCVTATNTDGSYWSNGYDSLGQLVSGKKYWSDGTPVAGEQFGYAFDNIGNRTSAQAGGNDRGEGLRTATYTANNLNQYSSRTVPGAADIIGTALSTATVTVNGQPTYRHTDYFRDQLGIDNSEGPAWQSVTNLGVVAGTTNTISNVTGNIFLPQDPETFVYDADGNLTNDGRWSYSWDAENRLVNMTSQTGAPAGSKFKLDFLYDYKGRRIQKLVSTNNGSWGAEYTNRFVYDSWNLVDELNGANDAIIYAFVWGLDLSGTLQGAGGVGGLLTVVTPSDSEFVSFDGNGNVSSLTDTTSSVLTAQYEYGPFGEVLRAFGPMGKVNPFRFSTKYQDDESDLLYYGYRYYIANIGRWLNRDPKGELGFETLRHPKTRASESVPRHLGLENLYCMLNNHLLTVLDLLGLGSVYPYPPDVAGMKYVLQEELHYRKSSYSLDLLGFLPGEETTNIWTVLKEIKEYIETGEELFGEDIGDPIITSSWVPIGYTDDPTVDTSFDRFDMDDEDGHNIEFIIKYHIKTTHHWHCPYPLHLTTFANLPPIDFPGSSTLQPIESIPTPIYPIYFPGPIWTSPINIFPNAPGRPIPY